MRRLSLLLATAVLLVGTLTACSSDDDDTKGMGDAPVATVTSGKRGGDDSPAVCTNMPDGYSNVCTKCVAGARPWQIITTTHTDTAPSSPAYVKSKKCGATDAELAAQTAAVMGAVGSGAQPPDDDGS